ncbi:MAG: cytochrome c-type biogenesis protein [Rickettsiales bacterium]
MAPLAIALLFFPLAAHAIAIEKRLDDSALEAEARDIFKELRCMTCAGESIYDSRSPLASNMRKKVRDDVAEGKSPDAITRYFVERYGDAILMAPPKGNVFLWALPIVLTATATLAGACVAFKTRRR